MTKKSRLIILLVCVACFLIATPVLIAYSMGYRFDFKKMKITETGGIYVRTFPPADQIIIDSKDIEKPGIFSNSIFVQNLLPENHSVSIKKAGYYDYFKTLAVQEKEVTKLENVLLFKKDIIFQTIADKTLSPFLPKKNTTAIKNALASETSNNNIIWLSTTGILYQSDSTGKNPVKLALLPLIITKKGSYKILAYGQNIFVNNNGILLALNSKTNSLDNFAQNVSDAKISPDGLNIVYYSGARIYISTIADPLKKQALLYTAPENVSGIFWINSNYIIFSDGDQIVISETDYRGNINTITIPSKSPKIFFDQQSGKLYILSQNILLASEKITP